MSERQSPSPFSALAPHNPAIALVEGDTQTSYAELNARVGQLSSALLAGKDDLQEARIAILLPASLHYVVSLHGIWLAGGIAVPLNPASQVPELEYFLANSGATDLLTAGDDPAALSELCDRLGVTLRSVDALLHTGATLTPHKPTPLKPLTPNQNRRAMILFTSGTTSKPKGVVITHASLAAQITTLTKAWCWQEQDVIPLFLPLHHIHGIVNILSCALWVGATVHLFPHFDLQRISQQVGQGSYTLFMGVPTIYVKLLEHLSRLNQADAEILCNGFRRMRLNVCGSAACPKPLFEQWQSLTGQTLLERYGMTETGMIISNPYTGERRPGHVGQALPGMEVQLFDEHNAPLNQEDIAGEIRVKGEGVFQEYWNNPSATAKSFKQGWFCTGDIAILEAGYYRIIGRDQIDIIKSGGYKLSALEIESTLLAHPDIAECAVIGVEDPLWGESVMAVIVLTEGRSLTYEALKHWCKGEMSAYKIPKAITIQSALPRNAMGKVVKPALKKLLQ